MIYKFSAILIEIPDYYFAEIDKLGPKIHMETHVTQNSQNDVDKSSTKSKRLILPIQDTVVLA